MNAYKKDCRKMFTNNIFRFISIVLIIMLGTAFFVGMNSISPAMKDNAQKYLKDQNVFDISLVSNLGYKEDDINKLKEVEHVKEIEGSYSFDALASFDNKDIVVRLISQDSESEINKCQLVEGKEIKKDDECLVDSRLASMYGYKIGDKIKVYRKDDVKVKDNLKNSEFKIIGITRNPAYISKFYGNTELLTGELNGLITIKKEMFKSEYFTQVYIKTDINNDIDRFSDDYKEQLDDICEKIEDKDKEIQEAKFDDVYNKNHDELENYKTQIKNSEEYLDGVKQQFEDAQIEINNGIMQIAATIREQRLVDDVNEIKTKYNDLDTVKEERKQLVSEYEGIYSEWSSLKNKLDSIDKNIDKDLYETYSLEDDEERYVELTKSVNKNTLKYNDLEKQFNEKNKEVEDKQKEYNDLSNQYNDLNKEILNKQKDLYDDFFGLENFIYSLNNDQIKIVYNKIKSSKEELEKKKKEFDDNNYDKQIYDAKVKVNDSEKELSEFKRISQITKLYDNSGFKGLKNDLVKMAIMGRIFPVMFYIVAALVTITTVTRMIEEDRKEIGTLKALGYSRGTIIKRYVSYSFKATLCGVILGILVGSSLILSILYFAYGTLYDMPSLPFSINWTCAVLSMVISMLTTVLFAYIITKKSLNENTAELMRPKVEKVGKTILLERIPAIWNRLSFLRKICFRNIFRYKRRLFMTLIGIAGCTMLIYSGLSLQSSITEIGEKQFTDVRPLTMEVLLKEADENEVKDIEEDVKKNNKIKEVAAVRQNSFTVESDDFSKDVFYIAIDGKEIDKYFKLADRKTQEKIELNDNGIVLTEKLANLLNVKKGDKVRVTDDGVNFTTKVSGVTENYLYNYVYLTPKMYKKIYGKDIKYNELFANTKDSLSEDNKVKLADELKKNENIPSVIYESQYNSEFNSSLRSLTSIVFLFVGCASLLSFIVLINLNNINIEERKRELATFKVLGFRKRELEKYVFRENIILTLLGTAVGLVFGILILGAIIQSAEVETIFLPKEINYINLAISAVVTFTFTIITNQFMKKKIRNIDMIDSLKSIE